MSFSGAIFFVFAARPLSPGRLNYSWMPSSTSTANPPRYRATVISHRSTLTHPFRRFLHSYQPSPCRPICFVTHLRSLARTTFPRAIDSTREIIDFIARSLRSSDSSVVSGFLALPSPLQPTLDISWALVSLTSRQIQTPYREFSRE